LPARLLEVFDQGLAVSPRGRFLSIEAFSHALDAGVREAMAHTSPATRAAAGGGGRNPLDGLRRAVAFTGGAKNPAIHPVAARPDASARRIRMKRPLTTHWAKPGGPIEFDFPVTIHYMESHAS
jgi:hypothetical protein